MVQQQAHPHAYSYPSQYQTDQPLHQKLIHLPPLSKIVHNVREFLVGYRDDILWRDKIRVLLFLYVAAFFSVLMKSTIKQGVRDVPLIITGRFQSTHFEVVTLLSILGQFFS